MAFSSRYNPPGNYQRIVALACRAQPGEWFELACGLTSDQAAKRVDRVQNRPNVAFRPAGTFQARKEQRGGLFVVVAGGRITSGCRHPVVGCYHLLVARYR